MASTGSPRLASTASSSRPCHASGSGSSPFQRSAAGQMSSPCTAMRFSVRVPVLSTASTVALPRLSTAAGQRASTPIRLSRRAPRARKRAITTGISLGSTARARASPASRASMALPSPCPPAATCTRVRAVQRPSAQPVTRPVSRRDWRCKGVGGASTAARLRPSRPSSVLPATASTAARPRPLATREPARIRAPACCRSTGRDSPVIRDSSSHSPTPSSRRPSAATRSPSSSRSRSPGRT